MQNGSGGGGEQHNNKFYGTIESMPAGRIGDWVVSGRIVHVTAGTWISEEHGAAAVGAYVEVAGTTRADGSWDATKIDVQNGSGGGGEQHNNKFYGTIESMPAGRIGDWVVSGRIVHVTAGTWISEEHGAAAVGAYVEVAGTTRADGSWDATKIDVQNGSGGGGEQHNNKFYGTIESMPAGRIGDWVVSGQTVHVTANTWVKEEHGAATVGAYVEVEGAVQADGSWNAAKIEVKTSPGGTNPTPPANDHFYGTVESMPAGRIGTWVVSGRNVQVLATTVIKETHGTAQVGAYVEVKGAHQTDGSTLATEIEVQSAAGSNPTPTPTPPSGGTVVYFDPAQANAALNNPLTIELDVANVADMGGFQLVITFDPAIVQVQNVTLGNFLSSTGRSVSPLGPTVDNTIGRISLGAFSFGSQAGPTGEGTLARITLMPQAQGSSALALSNLSVTDSAGNAIAASTQDGQVTVAATALNGDVNGDCSVDIVDIMQVAGRWGATSADADYDEADDLDNNGEIDIVDIMQVAGHWGDDCSANGFAAAGATMAPDASPALSLALPQAIKAGQRFTAEARVADAADLGGFEFRLDFDPAMLQVEDVALADWLAGSGNTCQALSDVDNFVGTVRIGGFCFGEQAGANGEGTIAQITFAAQAGGDAVLHLSNVRMTTMAGQSLQATATDDGLQVQVPASKVAPRAPLDAPADSIGR